MAPKSCKIRVEAVGPAELVNWGQEARDVGAEAFVVRVPGTSLGRGVIAQSAQPEAAFFSGAQMGRAELAGSWAEALRPFIKGGISGCLATICVQPIDFIKVQLQLQNFEGGPKRTPLSLAKDVVRREGLRGLYRGLDAGLIRQLTYSTGRLGIFRVLCDYYSSQRLQQGCQTGHLSFGAKALIGLVSGGVASFVCNPTDLALIRLQTNSLLPVDQRKSYRNVLQVLRHVIREEGFFSMWKGSLPSVIRAMSINMGMLATYDQCVETWIRWTGSVGRSLVLGRLVSSVISGAVASLVSLPFDIVKTQMQRQGVGGESEWFVARRGDCGLGRYRRITRHIYQSQGPGGFFRGYLTYYLRIAPHAAVTLLCMDWLNQRF
ncbi:oxoglutarate/malate translocator protein [Cryptosporidium canis]|nr:oxoglutarate/malate translocator protein [Cryptosporidium canis]